MNVQYHCVAQWGWSPVYQNYIGIRADWLNIAKHIKKARQNNNNIVKHKENNVFWGFDGFSRSSNAKNPGQGGAKNPGPGGVKSPGLGGAKNPGLRGAKNGGLLAFSVFPGGASARIFWDISLFFPGSVRSIFKTKHR